MNFNGTGTISIRNSYNVSSLTDHGAGAYQVNFSSNIGTNYAAQVSCQGTSSGENWYPYVLKSGGSNAVTWHATNYFRFQVGYASNTFSQDLGILCVTIHR